MQHTFQVGDRVIVGDATQGTYEVSRCGAIGTINEVLGYGFRVALDEPHLNNCDGVWYVPIGDLRHEIVLRKGDWVRYEKTDEVGTEKWNGKTGIITVVDWYGAYPTASVDGIENGILQANLVKIQPPQADDNDCIIHTFTSYTQEEPMQERQEDAIELGIQEKIQLLERQVEKAKCCLETYRDLKKFIDRKEE